MSEESIKEKENQVLVTGMISGNWSGTNEMSKNPMSKDYLSKSNLPKELIEDVKKSSLYKRVLEKFPDVDVFDVKKLKNKKQND